MKIVSCTANLEYKKTDFPTKRTCPPGPQALGMK